MYISIFQEADTARETKKEKDKWALSHVMLNSPAGRKDGVCPMARTRSCEFSSGPSQDWMELSNRKMPCCPWVSVTARWSQGPNSTWGILLSKPQHYTGVPTRVFVLVGIMICPIQNFSSSVTYEEFEVIMKSYPQI